MNDMQTTARDLLTGHDREGRSPGCPLGPWEILAGRQLAEYAFYSGFLSSFLVGSLPPGRSFWDLYARGRESPPTSRASQVPPGMEAAPRVGRAASRRGVARRARRGAPLMPPVPLNTNSRSLTLFSARAPLLAERPLGCALGRPLSRSLRRPMDRAGLANKHDAVLKKTQGEAK